MHRRSFFKLSALVVAGKSLYCRASFAKAKTYHQPPMDIPVVEENDVIVCGAGPAGIAAAVTAARRGLGVRLIDLHGFPGGVWTAGMVNNMLDHENKTGVMQDILQELEKTAAQNRANVFDIEAMKIALERLCRRAGVKPLYFSRVVAAVKNSKNRITHVIVENKSGRRAYAAKIFIDATGEGDVAAQAGCSFSWGHPKSGKTQPLSMIALLGGIRYNELNPLKVVRGDGISGETAKKFLLQEMQRAGVTPSYTKPTLFRIRNDHFAMMANHEYGVSAIDAQALTDATIRAREEIHKMVNALKQTGGVWKDIRILATSPCIGVREGRRIHGRYTLTKDDLVRGARFKDAVCRATFCVDIHSLDLNQGGAYSHEGVVAKPYDIPLRSLIAKDVDGLLMAGRCISGDFYAHASYRVTGNAVPMGEAAGKLAAVAAAGGRMPHQVGFEEL